MASHVASISTFSYGGSPPMNCGIAAYAYVTDGGVAVADGTTVQQGSTLSTTGSSPPAVPNPGSFATSTGTVFGFVNLANVSVIGTLANPPTVPVTYRWWVVEAYGADSTHVRGEYLFTNTLLGGCITSLVSGSSLLVAAAGSGTVMLTFTIPNCTDPAVPLRTTVERRTLPAGSFAQVAALPQAQAFYLDTSVTNGTSYQYRVKHTPVAGQGIFTTAEGVTHVTSNTVTVTPRAARMFWGEIVQA